MEDPQKRPLQQQRLHRQHRRRRNSATVMDQSELALLLRVDEANLKAALIRISWPFHEDAMGQIWASVDPDRLTRGNATTEDS